MNHFNGNNRTLPTHQGSFQSTHSTSPCDSHKTKGFHEGTNSLAGNNLRTGLLVGWWGRCRTGRCSLRRTAWTPGCDGVWWRCPDEAAAGGCPRGGPAAGYSDRRRPQGWWTRFDCGQCGAAPNCEDHWMSLCWFLSLCCSSSLAPMDAGQKHRDIKKLV